MDILADRTGEPGGKYCGNSFAAAFVKAAKSEKASFLMLYHGVEKCTLAQPRSI
jgi:hypothetical protein